MAIFDQLQKACFLFVVQLELYRTLDEILKFVCYMTLLGNLDIFDQSQKAYCFFVIQLVLYSVRNHRVSLLYMVPWECGSL